MEAALNRLRWEALALVYRAGAAGVMAALLTAGCAMAWWAWYQPLLQQVRSLVDANAGLQQRVAARSPAGTGASSAPTPRQQLAEFSQRFPDEKGITPVFARVHGMALRHGLQLQQAEFRLSGTTGERLARYSMVLPVKADYRSLRAFIDEVLRDVPSVALEELSLRRDDAKAQQLEGRLRFVMFVARSPA